VEAATLISDARRVVSSTHFDAIACEVVTDESGGEAFYSWLQRERRSSAQRVSFVTSGVTDAYREAGWMRGSRRSTRAGRSADRGARGR
jgi:hypothetical protein